MRVSFSLAVLQFVAKAWYVYLPIIIRSISSVHFPKILSGREAKKEIAEQNRKLAEEQGRISKDRRARVHISIFQ
jgi:hypothetical protein